MQAAVEVGQAVGIEAELGEHRGVKVLDVEPVLDRGASGRSSVMAGPWSPPLRTAARLSTRKLPRTFASPPWHLKHRAFKIG